MSVCAFEHPILSGLLGDGELAALFDSEADIAAMLRFELALAQAQAECGVISNQDAENIASAIAKFRLDLSALRAALGIDGVVVPELVRQLRATVGQPSDAKVHFGATSQDVIDSSLMLRLKAAANVLVRRLAAVADSLSALVQRDGHRSLMGYTRMQAAIPIGAADRIMTWQAPLERDLSRLSVLLETNFAIQFGGAAGTLEKLGDKGSAVRAALATRLDLVDLPQWHNQRDLLAEFAGVLSLITGTLGKFGQDIALMAEVGGEIVLAGGGGSSAMPHKQNPVAAELLVTLARFNAAQISAIHHSLVHEQERSGSAWVLEWLVLPPMVSATGVALLTADRLLGQIQMIGRGSGGLIDDSGI